MSYIPVATLFDRVRAYTKRRDLSDTDLQAMLDDVRLAVEPRMRGRQQLYYIGDPWTVTEETAVNHESMGYTYPVATAPVELLHVLVEDREYLQIPWERFSEAGARGDYFRCTYGQLARRGGQLPSAIQALAVDEVSFDRFTLEYWLVGASASYIGVTVNNGTELFFAAGPPENLNFVTVPEITRDEITSVTLKAYDVLGNSIEASYTTPFRMRLFPPQMSGVIWSTVSNDTLEMEGTSVEDEEGKHGTGSVTGRLVWAGGTIPMSVSPVSGTGTSHKILRNLGSEGIPPNTDFSGCWMEALSDFDPLNNNIRGIRRWELPPVNTGQATPPTETGTEVEIYSPITEQISVSNPPILPSTNVIALYPPPELGETYRLDIGLWLSPFDYRNDLIVQVMATAIPIIRNALTAEACRFLGWDERAGTFDGRTEELLSAYNEEGRKARMNLTKHTITQHMQESSYSDTP